MKPELYKFSGAGNDFVVADGRSGGVEALREAGAEVLGIASIFTYGMQKSIDRLAEADTATADALQSPFV